MIYELLLGVLCLVQVEGQEYGGDGYSLDPCVDGSLLAATTLCDVSMTLEARAREFVALLTLEEKADQMINTAPAIERLGLPAYQWWNEALHGVLFNCIDGHCPTSFPSGLALAATFDMELVEVVANRISTEARAVHIGSGGAYGLNVWTPNVNIYRDPRWGRGQETPGEDPYLTSQYAIRYLRGMQEHGFSTFPKLAATIKHFAVYNLEQGREWFDAKVSARDLTQTYLPTFAAAITKGKSSSIMCSYNRVNGVPACASILLLQTYLRETWKFDGFVVSDCDAIEDIYELHHVATSFAEAAAMAVQAGVDLNCGKTYKYLPEAVDNALITEEIIDESVTRLFLARLRLGLFDPPLSQPYNKIQLAVIDSTDHRRIALTAARSSLILLKSITLPLASDPTQTLLLTGPHSISTDMLCGNYHGQLPHVVSLREGLEKESAMKLLYEPGATIAGMDEERTIAAAVEAAAKANVVVVAVGLDQSQEREAQDRAHLRLPGQQEELLKRVAAVNDQVIVVVVGGGSVDLSWAKQSPSVIGILLALYPGEETGTAVAEALIGTFSPSGRLPITFYGQHYADQVDLLSMDMREGPGKTYRFYTDAPVFEFGYGLSYTTFDYTWGSTLPAVFSNDIIGSSLSFTIIATNTGHMTSDHSVLAFVETQIDECPRRQLISFDKMFSIAPGHAGHVVLTWSPELVGCVDSNGTKVSPNGQYTLVIGALRHTIATGSSSEIAQSPSI